MPNGETAAASGAVGRGEASRIGYQVGQIGSSKRMQSGGGVAGTNVRTVSSKPKGYSTERGMKGVRSLNKSRGQFSPSPKTVSDTHKNMTSAKKRVTKGRKKKAKKSA